LFEQLTLEKNAYYCRINDSRTYLPEYLPDGHFIRKGHLPIGYLPDGHLPDGH